jgi:hypothetical protein
MIDLSDVTIINEIIDTGILINQQPILVFQLTAVGESSVKQSLDLWQFWRKMPATNKILLQEADKHRVVSLTTLPLYLIV